MNKTKKIDHMGVRIELIGRIGYLIIINIRNPE
jgi:hypothetical protein